MLTIRNIITVIFSISFCILNSQQSIFTINELEFVQIQRDKVINHIVKNSGFCHLSVIRDELNINSLFVNLKHIPVTLLQHKHVRKVNYFEDILIISGKKKRINVTYEDVRLIPPIINRKSPSTLKRRPSCILHFLLFQNESYVTLDGFERKSFTIFKAAEFLVHSFRQGYLASAEKNYFFNFIISANGSKLKKENVSNFEIASKEVIWEHRFVYLVLSVVPNHKPRYFYICYFCSFRATEGISPVFLVNISAQKLSANGVETLQKLYKPKYIAFFKGSLDYSSFFSSERDYLMWRPFANKLLDIFNQNANLPIPQAEILVLEILKNAENLTSVVGTSTRVHVYSDRDVMELEAYLSQVVVVTKKVSYTFLTCHTEQALTFAIYTNPFKVELWIGIIVTLIVLTVIWHKNTCL